MTRTTHDISIAIDLLVQACDCLEDRYAEDRYVVAAHTMQLLGSLTAEFSPDYFSEAEIELISESTIAALEALMEDEIHNNREDYS